MKGKTAKLTTLAMMSAIACALVFFSRYLPPMFLPFLHYDPKDIIIVLAGFIYGPLSSFVISVVVSLVELVSGSETGIIGLIMNVISTCTFACTAAVIYKKKRTLSGAVIGLVVGCLFTTVAMLLWNYLIAPLYMEGTTREQIKGLLFTSFMPFNLVKSGLNAAFTMVLYKPVVTALRKAKLLPRAEDANKGKVMTSVAISVISVLIIASLIAVMLIKG